jgi:hypothetical protein
MALRAPTLSRRAGLERNRQLCPGITRLGGNSKNAMICHLVFQTLGVSGLRES